MARFTFDGCDTVELAKTYGTPLYVLSGRMIRENLRELRSVFLDRWPGSSAAYAGKALQTLDLLRILASEGMGLDAVSGGELYAASRAGFPMERVLFHGNNKSGAELRLALELGVGRVVVDNPDEMALLDAIAGESGRRVPVLARVTPGVDSHTHRHISTGQLDSKFGMGLRPDARDGWLGALASSRWLEPRGFHFHVGSQISGPGSHRLALEATVGLMAHAGDAFGLLTPELNMGGGFGVRYTEADAPAALGDFTDALMGDLHRLCGDAGLPVPAVTIEPGRWLVAAAGITLYTVGSRKEIPGVRSYVSVDGGMTDNPRPALYDARYEATVADRHDSPRDRVVTVAGKCCESGDILIRDIALQDPRPGDTLAVLVTGAYNHSMASTYNRTPRPAMVLTDSGRHRLSVRRETWEDLLSREL